MFAIEKYKSVIEEQNIKNILASILIVYGLISYYIFRNYIQFCDGIVQFNDRYINMLFVMIFFIMCILIGQVNKIDVKLRIIDWLVFLIMAVCFVVSAGFQKQDSLDFIKTDFVFVILSVISWTYIFSRLFLVYSKYKKSEKREISQFKLMLLLLCFWLPYIIIFYPGATSWDGMYQLNQFAGVQELTNKHPIEVTYFMGAIIKFGTMIVNQEFGLFLYNILQTLFLAYVLSYGLGLIKKIGCSDRAFFVVSALMVLVPIPLFSSYVLLKDGFYAAFCTWFCFIILKLYAERESFMSNKVNYLLLALSELGILFFRKNGIYVIVLSVIVLIIKEKKWKEILTISVLCIMCFKISDGYIENYFNVAKENKAEIYSLPLQQTARYYTYYYDELTEKEKGALKDVINIEAMVNSYNEALSDPVKKYFNEEASDEQVSEFFKIWFRNFFRHPRVYIEAFLGNANAYIDPTAPMLSERGFFYISHVEETDAYMFDFSVKSLENMRHTYRKTFQAGENIAIVGLLFQPGTYFWLLIFTTLAYIREKNQMWKCLMPLYITFLICLVSPVNGAVRYILPLIETLPMLVIVCKTTEEKQMQIET